MRGECEWQVTLTSGLTQEGLWSVGSRGGGRNQPRDFKGERRRHETHESTTDPEARLCRKGSQQEAQLCYLGHLLTENPDSLVVDVELTQADGYAQRDAALATLERSDRPPYETASLFPPLLASAQVG